MEMKSKRTRYTDRSTTSDLSVGGKHECWILEDTRRPDGEKVYGRTCIPPGRYKVIITRSQRFGVDLPLLVDVSGFSGVRIHPGNTDADTEGCLLPGRTRATDRVGESRVAFDALFAKIKDAIDDGEGCWITVEDGDEWKNKKAG
mgnify:CR=1 FL=1